MQIGISTSDFDMQELYDVLNDDALWQEGMKPEIVMKEDETGSREVSAIVIWVLKIAGTQMIELMVQTIYKRVMDRDVRIDIENADGDSVTLKSAEDIRHFNLSRLGQELYFRIRGKR